MLEIDKRRFGRKGPEEIENNQKEAPRRNQTSMAAKESLLYNQEVYKGEKELQSTVPTEPRGEYPKLS